MIQTQWARLAGLALGVVSCGGEKEATNTAVNDTTQPGPALGGTAQASQAQAGACTSGTPATGFVTGTIGSQSGTFVVEFDATPASDGSDAIVGLSSGSTSAYAGLAAIVRFNPDGRIDARNGGAYAADAVVPYVAGSSYHFRMDVSVVDHRYSVHVVSPNVGSTLLASNYAFRSEQAKVAKLDSYALKVDTGGLAVCGVAVTQSCNVAVPSGGFVNSAFAPEARFLTASFTATPGANAMDGVVALSPGRAGTFNDLAAAVRFSDTGVIEARKGDVYAADLAMTYVKDVAYRVQMVTDVGFHSYSVLVNDNVIARNFAFRTQQANVASLANVALVSDSPAGRLTVCDFHETPPPPQVLYIHDAQTLASHGIVVPTGGAVDPSGDTYTSAITPARDALVLSRFDRAGTPIWSRSFPLSGGVEITLLGSGGDGRVAVVGRLDGRLNFGGAGNLGAGSFEDGAQAFGVRLDSNGVFVDGGVGTLSIIRKVVLDAHTNVYASGYRFNPDRFLLNVFAGNIQEWSGDFLVPPLFLGVGNDVAVDSARNVYWNFSPRLADGALDYAVKFAPLAP